MNLTARIAFLLTLLTTTAWAQDAYPSKPITIIVPFSAGGPMDKLARDLSVPMKDILKQPVIVQNMSGAGGNLGAAIVVRNQGDGYTLLMSHIGMATSPALFRNLGFKPDIDFVPLGVVAEIPQVLVARPAVPNTSVVDLVRWMAAQPQVKMAHAGIGSSSHLCGLLIKQSLKMSLTTIPYRGSAPAVSDLLGGHVDMMCDPIPTTAAHIQDGKLKAIAVSSAKPLIGTTLAAVPTMAKFGIPNVELSIWFALYAPKDTPVAIQQQINNAVRASVKTDAFKRAQVAAGVQIVQDERATLAGHKAYLSRELARWTPIIKAAGVYAD